MKRWSLAFQGDTSTEFTSATRMRPILSYDWAITMGRRPEQRENAKLPAKASIGTAM
jgi:hypothetical protein